MTTLSTDFIIFEAFREAGIAEKSAKAVVEAINTVIDARYQIHAKQLATQGDVERVRVEVAHVQTEIEKLRSETTQNLAAMKSDLTRWIVTMAFAGPALLAAVTKLLN
jgi:demethoxyubiquinone hydroxylase (CLK1/Coq7/Cat5 family)